MYAAIDRLGIRIVSPQGFQTSFTEESCTQICLGIEISRHDPYPKIGVHPCQVINQRGFAYAAFVIEKCDYWNCHERLLKVTSILYKVDASNSGGGLPFFAISRRA